MIYPKTDTLWKRHPKTGIIIPQNYSKNEFGNIKWWHVTEKIDGMNVRIEYQQWRNYDLNISIEPIVKFRGRTDKAQMPTELMQYLEVVFNKQYLNDCFPNARYVCLFGEGYGHKIQKGGHQYTPNQEFILFDIIVDGWWLKQSTVTEIAKFFDIPRVPELGIWTKEYAQDFVDPRVSIEPKYSNTFDNIPLSVTSIEPRQMEGIMCRSHPLMLFRNGNPIQFKLKVKDYERLIE